MSHQQQSVYNNATTGAQHTRPGTPEGVAHDDFLGEWFEAHVRHAADRSYMMPTTDEPEICPSATTRIMPGRRSGNTDRRRSNDSGSPTMSTEGNTNTNDGPRSQRMWSAFAVPCLPEDGECADQLYRIRNDPWLNVASDEDAELASPGAAKRPKSQHSSSNVSSQGVTASNASSRDHIPLDE